MSEMRYCRYSPNYLQPIAILLIQPTHRISLAEMPSQGG